MCVLQRAFELLRDASGSMVQLMWRRERTVNESPGMSGEINLRKDPESREASFALDRTLEAPVPLSLPETGAPSSPNRVMANRVDRGFFLLIRRPGWLPERLLVCVFGIGRLFRIEGGAVWMRLFRVQQ